MRHRVALVALASLVASCHGIEHPSSPTTPAAVASVPTTLTVVQSPGELPVGGGTAMFTVSVMNQAGAGIRDVRVAMHASSGTLAGDSVRTDGSGYGAMQWDGTSPGTLTASIGDLVTTSPIRVNAPIVFPPPAPPRPPTPQPTPEPLPPIPPSLTVTLTATPLQIPAGSATTLSAAVDNLNAGESVTSYEWEWAATGATMTVDETSVTASRSHLYATDGIQTPRVRIATSTGRSTAATGRVIVYRP